MLGSAGGGGLMHLVSSHLCPIPIWVQLSARTLQHVVSQQGLCMHDPLCCPRYARRRRGTRFSARPDQRDSSRPELGEQHAATRCAQRKRSAPFASACARSNQVACLAPMFGVQVLTGTLEQCQPVLHWTEPQQLQGSSYMDLRQRSNAEASSSGSGVVANGRLLTVCGTLQSTAEAAQHSASGSIAVISTDPQQYNGYEATLDAGHTTTPVGSSSASTSGGGAVNFIHTGTAISVQPSASITNRGKGRRKDRIEQLLHSLDAAFASSPTQISSTAQPPVLSSGTSALPTAPVAGAHAGQEKQRTSRRLFQRLQAPTVAGQVQSSPQADSPDAPRQEQGQPAQNQKQHAQKQQRQLRWQSQRQRVKLGAQAAKRRPASGSGLSRAAAMGPTALHRSIRQARSAADLVRLYLQQQQYMDISHTAAMMWRLAALVQRTATHRAVMTQAEGRLWARLRDKALLTVSTAQAAQLVDVLSAVHCVAAAREQHHLGWARQRPQGTSSAPGGAPSSSPTPSQQQRSQQQPRSQQQHQASVSSQPASQGRLGRFADALASARSDGQSQASTSGRMQSGSSSAGTAATLGAAAFAMAADRRNGAAVAGDGSLRGAAGRSGASSTVVQSGSVAGSFATPPPRPILPRPLHSSESVLRYERELVQAVLQRSTVLMAQAAGQAVAGQATGQAAGQAGAGAAQARAQAALGQRGVALRNLLSIGSAVGRLNVPAGAGWQAAFYAATLPHLPRLQRPELAELCCAVGRLQPSRKPPAIWMTAFYARSQVLMPNLEVSELSSLLTCVSRLPGPYPEGWVMSAVRRCGESVDVLDAPAYALVLHALGRMRQRSLRPWVQELLESSTSLLYDFSPGVGGVCGLV